MLHIRKPRRNCEMTTAMKGYKSIADATSAKTRCYTRMESPCNFDKTDCTYLDRSHWHQQERIRKNCRRNLGERQTTAISTFYHVFWMFPSASKRYTRNQDTAWDEAKKGISNHQHPRSLMETLRTCSIAIPTGTNCHVTVIPLGMSL